MSTESVRHALNGPAMGARWSAVFHMPQGADPAPAGAAMAAAVAEVEAQMSVRRPDSDLMRLNRAGAGDWVTLPAGLMQVLAAGLAVGHASGGAFDIGLGDAVSAWGFSGDSADAGRIRAALEARRRPAHEVLELDPSGGRARKHGPLALDLCGIAKGHGVDRLAQVATAFGMDSALLSIDGEVRAIGTRPDGRPWAVAVELPDPVVRAAHSVLTLQDAAAATSGDYRHWVDVGGRRLSHTMDPRRGAPLGAGPASVTVVAGACIWADAWATAMMVLGREAGGDLARRLGLSVLFLDREGAALSAHAVGAAFGTAPCAA